MPMYFQKTENALKRAREFIEVDKKESALECLNDVIHSKKHRQTWTTTHEHIMRLFVELCVDLQRSAFAKDGLYQYRNICREVSLHSFEVVVKFFLKLASDRASAAREKSEQAVLQEVEDLDVIMTPENLLLSTVSGEGVKERSDRVLLAPWVKFLWESYRNMMELLKNNNTIERLYADVAKDAFKFCLKYQRRTEFRKLCEILKNHLQQAQKYQTQSHSLRFDNQDTIQCLVDVRFEQLECSISIDLWQEAFKAIEEIHNLLELSGKTPKPGLLDNYYSRQSKVYWMANNRLFHAAALHKMFVLWKEQKKSISPEDLQRIASRVLLATLCVPIEPTPSDVDRFLEVDQNDREKARRLAALLRVTSLPSRASLLRDVGRHSVLQHTPLELQQLYSCLEVEFNPLQLCKKVSPILDGLAEDEVLQQYVEPAREVLLVRLIKEVSQVYETVKLDWLAKLVPFTSSTHLETVVIETAHSNGIQVHIDHQANCLRFGSDMSFSYKNETPEGPYVQPMPSEALCCQLQTFSAALQQAVQIIASKETEREHAETMRELAQVYLDHARADNRNALARKQLIEARKEYIESRSRAKEHKENEERRQKEQKERKAELERLEREAVERAESKKQKELAERARIEVEQRIESLKKTPVGVRALETITQEELDQMDVDTIMAKQLKQMEKEMRERETKLRTQEKKIDHWERAKRLVELPLLEKQYQQQIVEDRAFHEQQEEERVATEIKDRKEKEENRERMGQMESSGEEFLDIVQSERHEAHLVELREFEAMLEVARTERMEKRRLERKARRKAEAIALKEAEAEKELRTRQEEEKARREEERRQRQEVVDVQLMKQRQREEEIEAKQRRREEEAQQALQERQRGRGPTEEESDWRTSSDQQSAWRREETEMPPPKWRDSEGRGRDDGGGNPSPRTGAYRPPIRREADGGGGGGAWRVRGEDDRQREPETRPEEGEGMRRAPQGILKGERGRGERETERERGVSWEDERKPPVQKLDTEQGGGWRGGGGKEDEGVWKREERDASPRMHRRDGDRERDEWRGRGQEDRGGWRREGGMERATAYGGPPTTMREREPGRRGWGREDGERDGWRRDGDRPSGWRGREGESERGDGWRGREGEPERGGGWRGREGEPERGGGWRGREGEPERGGGWRGREGDRGGGGRWGEGEPDRWRGRETDDRGGGGWRGGRRDGGFGDRGDRGGGGWRGGRDDSDRGGGGWRDRDADRMGGGGVWRDRDQGPPRRYDDQRGEPEERGPPRRDDARPPPRQREEQGDWHGGGGPRGGGGPAPEQEERRGEEGWEVVGRKR